VDNDGKQEEEEATHQRKKTHQKNKKHWRKHPEHESDKNNGRKKETTVRWVEGQKRNDYN
jgi:hypothetical protein